jgi:hypothetical protein
MTVSFMDPPASPSSMATHVNDGLQLLRPDIKSTLIPTEFQDFDDIDILLADECAQFFDDPLGWVMWAFDWGHGDLNGFDGPDEWQRDELIALGNDIKGNRFNGVDPVDPVRAAIASGHGIGKSALTSWLILFIMSTRPYAKGIVTANTGEQLRTKTWSELGKWRERCIVGHWFEYNNGKGSMSLYHKSFPSSWRVDAQTCREENSEAFAGLHAANSTPFYLFDEASAVPSKIWEVAEGGLTDGEPMFFCFGNPTRNDGKFHDCFNPNSRWRTKQIDSRNAKMTNKRLIEQWKVDHGEDSDFFRVRVKGQFPKAGDMQFMPSDVVEACQTLPLGQYLGDEPLIMSFDVARGGGDDCRISFRRGDDAKSETSYRITYENSRDTMKMLSKVVMVIERHKPNAIFVDSTGVGGPVHDRLRELGYNSYEVHFGSKADDESRYYNKTAEMGDRLRKWMMARGRIPNDEQLKRELICREFWHDDKGRLILERKPDIKTRLGYSPDWADSMYLLFAMENVPRLHYKRSELDVAPWARENASNRSTDYDPLEYADDSV